MTLLNTRGLFVLFGCAILSASVLSARADVFNMPQGLASIRFAYAPLGGNLGEQVGEGAGGNGPTLADCGVAAHDYRVALYEVTVAQYTEFLNAVAKTDTYGLFIPEMSGPLGCKITRDGAAGNYKYTYLAGNANKPVNFVSWASAARFINWLHNGQPTGAQSAATTETGCYTMAGAVNEEDLIPLSYEGGRYFLPWENEWHKAAYYTGNGGVYYKYPTSNDAVPNVDVNGTNAANYQVGVAPPFAPAPFTTIVASFSRTRTPIMTYDMGGNVWEWVEDTVAFADTPNGYKHQCSLPSNECKVIRGGAYDSPSRMLEHVWRDAFNPAKAAADIGFRVFALYWITDGAGITDATDPSNNANNNLGFMNPVGGVSINADGVLRNTTVDELGELRRQRLRITGRFPSQVAQGSELRKISLRGIDAAVAESIAKKRPLSESIRYLGGLQRIKYVFVYPDKQDVVLVGPGEGWKVDARGNVVGAQSGRSVMLLADLVTSLRSARQAARGGISCSIDPTPEGLAKLREVAKGLTEIGDPLETAAGIEQTLGTQQISVKGVKSSTRFANVLVAADYRMKRIAMGFEPSPVKGLPSFLQMMSGSGHGMSNMLPRWWLEPTYEPLLRDADGVAWELRGGGVKAMTEEDFLLASGGRQHTGKANPLAKRWADMMTAKYGELAVAEPIFGDLQNCMDLAIVSALITKERLLDKAGCSLPTILDESRFKLAEYPAPKTVDSKASVLKKGHNWIISASGGVLIDSWGIANRTELSEEPAKVQKVSTPGKGKSWLWN